MIWLNSVRVYLMVNWEIYNTNKKKIASALSFMKKGSAQTWATTFIQDTLDSGVETDEPFGTFVNFAIKFRDPHLWKWACQKQIGANIPKL